jgi:hypothetical protein
MFAHTDPSFVISLVQRLHSIVYLPDDVICKSGEVGETMYFICEGAVAVVGVNETTLAEFVWRVLDPGQYFGEIALVMENCVRTATVRAMKICELAELSKKDFDVLMDIYPLQFQQIKVIMEDRLRAYAQRSKQAAAPSRVTSLRRGGGIQEAQPTADDTNAPPGKRRSLIDMGVEPMCGIALPSASEAAPGIPDAVALQQVSNPMVSVAGAPEIAAAPSLDTAAAPVPLSCATDAQLPQNEDVPASLPQPASRRRSLAERREMADVAPLRTTQPEPAKIGPATFMTNAATERAKKAEEIEYTPSSLQRRRSRAESISVTEEQFGLGSSAARLVRAESFNVSTAESYGRLGARLSASLASQCRSELAAWRKRPRNPMRKPLRRAPNPMWPLVQEGARDCALRCVCTVMLFSGVRV